MKRNKVFRCILLLICIALQMIPGSALVKSSLDQGTRVVYNETTYYAFANIGIGLYTLNAVFILTSILIIDTLILMKTTFSSYIWILIITISANLVNILFFESITVYSIIIEVLLGVLLVEWIISKR